MKKLIDVDRIEALFEALKLIFRINVFNKQILAFRVDESECDGRANTRSHCKLW